VSRYLSGYDYGLYSIKPVGNNRVALIRLEDSNVIVHVWKFDGIGFPEKSRNMLFRDLNKRYRKSYHPADAAALVM